MMSERFAPRYVTAASSPADSRTMLIDLASWAGVNVKRRQPSPRSCMKAPFVSREARTLRAARSKSAEALPISRRTASTVASNQTSMATVLLEPSGQSHLVRTVLLRFHDPQQPIYRLHYRALGREADVDRRTAHRRVARWQARGLMLAYLFLHHARQLRGIEGGALVRVENVPCEVFGDLPLPLVAQMNVVDKERQAGGIVAWKQRLRVGVHEAAVRVGESPFRAVFWSRASADRGVK